MNYQLTDGMLDCKIRTARKEHRCRGGYDPVNRRYVKCFDPICKGEQYVEYFGFSAPYESGERYHMRCAAQQNLVEVMA